jgi:hypothetical protein
MYKISIFDLLRLRPRRLRKKNKHSLAAIPNYSRKLFSTVGFVPIEWEPKLMFTSNRCGLTDSLFIP